MVAETLLQVRYTGDRDEVVVRCGGYDQRVQPGGFVLATADEAERMSEQIGNWEVADSDAPEVTLDELKLQAADMDVDGRSSMNKDELAAAIAEKSANPIGAVGDPEAVREANRIAAAGGIGIADQADVVHSASSDDGHDVDETVPGSEPDPVDVVAPAGHLTDEQARERGFTPLHSTSDSGAGEPGVDEDGEA